MEAESRLPSWCRLAIVGMFFLASCPAAFAASLRTQNFLITAPSPQLAQAVADAAERYRRDLAIHWLGGPLAPWPTPCPIRVVAGDNLAAQGVTTYNPAPVRDFQMEVIGTPERILDSVLPHEVTHTILATYFGRPLPRWADEGICTTVEHASERSKHEAKLREFLRSRRGIAMNQLFLMKEYPADVLPMYAQGYSVCRFLIDQKGPRTFIEFLGDYMKHQSWTANVKRHYGYDSLKELQDYWLAWVAQGGGPVEKFAKTAPTAAGAPGSEIAAAGPANQIAQASATSPPLPNQPASPSRPAATDLSLTAPASKALASLAPLPARPNAALARPFGSEASPTQLASTSSDGFYVRKRLEAESQPSSAQSLEAVKPMVPPSVRNSGPYQSAHPQPEQSMSRSGTPIQWAGGPVNSSGQFMR